jgi:23S rRNA pseudouridine2605 synthase
VYSVGRLDEDSTGLMILTNDGDLANRLAHPRYGVEKTYRALVAGSPSQEVIRKLSEGIWLSEGKVRAKRARVVGTQGEATLLELVLAEGKKREIRRMLAKLGHKVMSLTRIAIGPVVLKGLSVGEYRPLSRSEVEMLRNVAAGVEISPLRSLGRDASGGGREKRPRAGGAKRAEGTPPRSESRAPHGGRQQGERERQGQGQGPPRSRPPRASASGKEPRKPLPGKPAAARPLPGKSVAGKPIPGKPPASGKLPGRLPAQKAARETTSQEEPPTTPLRRPGPDAAPARTPAAESGPRRKIIGLPPRLAAEAGLTISGRPARKRPAVKRPPRRIFGIRRPGEGGGEGDHES